MQIHTPQYCATLASHRTSTPKPDAHRTRARSVSPRGRKNFPLLPCAKLISLAPAISISIPSSYLNSGCAHQNPGIAPEPRLVSVYSARTASPTFRSRRRPQGATRPEQLIEQALSLDASTVHGIRHASPWSGSDSVASTVGTSSSQPNAPASTNPEAPGSSIPIP